MDDKLKIHLQIDRERYPLVINREKKFTTVKLPR